MIKQLLMSNDKYSTNKFILVGAFIVSSIVVLYTMVKNPDHLTGVLGFYLSIAGTLTATKGFRDHAKEKLNYEQKIEDGR